MSLTALLSKHRNKVVLAAMKPVQHTSRRKFMPFANAVMAAQHAGWSMKLDISNRFLPYYNPFCVPETASCSLCSCVLLWLLFFLVWYEGEW